MGINRGKTETEFPELSVDVGDAGLIYVDSSNRVGIGVSDPDSELEVLATTTQLKLSYDANSFISFTVADASHTTIATGESGNLTLDAAGDIELNADGADIVFKDGTHQLAKFAAGSATLVMGSGVAEDTMVLFDGNAQDFRIGLDDGTDTLEIGHGIAHGTNTAITIDSSGQVTKFNIPAAAVTQASDHIIFLDGGATGAPKAESIDDFLTAIAGSGISVSSSQLTATTGDITGVTAGVGLSGGGATGDLTLTLDLSELSTVTPADGDFFATLDSDGANEQKTTTTALATLLAGTASATGLTASNSVLTVSDLHSVGVSGSANQMLTDDGDGTVTSESNLSFDGSTLAVTGAATTTTTMTVGTDLTVTGGDMTFGAGQDASVIVANTAHNVAGKPLTIASGNPVAGTTNNIAGGDLVLQGGPGKGSGAGGDIIFRTANAGGSGSSLNSQATALTLSDDLSATFAGIINIAASQSYQVNGTAILSDSSGTMTLSNINALDATTEATIETAIDTLSNLASIGTITTGVWNGTAIASAYLDADTAHLSGTQTFSGAKTFTTVLDVLNATTSSTTQGGKLVLAADDGAAMGQNHRLGVIEFKGAEDGAATLTIGARIQATCDAGWSASENGTSLEFFTTDGNASESLVLRMDSDKRAGFEGAVDAKTSLTVLNTTASAADQGGSLVLQCDDGAAMASGHRLGVIEFQGAEDGSATQTTGARIEALCDAGWSASENGASLLFYTTDANASQSEVLKLDSNKLATFAGPISIPASQSYQVAGTAILSDSGGTMTLSNVNALDATTEATIETAIDTLSNLTSVGTLTTGVWNAGAVTSSGRIISDSSTDATSTTDGSIQTDGGLSVALDLVVGNDIKLLSDAAVIHWGDDSEVQLFHQENQGLILELNTDVSAKPTFVLKNIGNHAAGPGLIFVNDNHTGEQDGDVLGTILFYGDDSGDTPTGFVKLSAISSDVTNTDEGGEFKFEVMLNDGSTGNHALTEAFTITGGLEANAEIVVNEAGVNLDFRVEGNTDANLFFVDASVDRVSIGVSTNAPAALFEVSGDGATGTSLVQFNNDDTNQMLLDINAANIDADVIDISADAVTTANVIDITADGLTSGSVIAIEAAGSSGTARNLIEIRRTHADAANATYLKASAATGSAMAMQIKELSITLNTGSAQTTSSNFFPAGAIAIALAVRVTTQIDSTKHITKIGIGTSDPEDTIIYGNPDVLGDGVLDEANDTQIFGLNWGDQIVSLAAQQDLVITCNGTPSAGIVNVALYYWAITAPTS